MNKGKIFGVCALVCAALLLGEISINASECISSSDEKKNIGHCAALVDGSGDVCVDAHWYEVKNCYRNTSIEENA